MAVKASATITLSFMVDVKAVYRYYKLQASTTSAPSVPTSFPPTGWTDSEPTYTEGSTNTLYTVDCNVFTDDSFIYTPVSKSTSYEAAKAAYNKAVNAQNTANDAEANSNRGLNKWLIQQYSSTDTTMYTVDKLIKSKIAAINCYEYADASLNITEMGQDLTSNYTAYAKTYCLFSEETTVTTTFLSDDGATTYLNGVQIGQNTIYTPTGSTIEFNFKKGWNLIEVLWHEGIGGDGFRFGVTISANTNCTRMDCYSTGYSGSSAYELASNAAMLSKIASVDVEYYLSTSATSLAGGSWQTTAPTWVDGKYMWSRTKITDGAGNVTYKPSETGTCIAGATGATGATGKGVKSIVEQYYQSTSSTSQTGGSWSTTVPTWADGKYIWTRSVITYTDNSTVTTTAVCVTGQKGSTGATGKGVSSTSVTYQACTSGTTAPTGTWSTTIPSVTKGQYLWTKTVITYTDNATSTSYSVSYIPTNGTNGINGTNGTSVTISSTSVTYQASSSGTTAPTGTWSSSVPSVSNGQYLWTKTVVNYSPSGSTTSYSVAYKGTNGTNGTNGKNGTSVTISSTAITYQTSESNTTVPTGSWSSSVQATTTAKPYLWTKTVVNYSPSGSTTSYSVSSTMDSIEVGGRNLTRDSKEVTIWYCKYGSNQTHSVQRNGNTYIVNGRTITNPYEVSFVSGGTGDMRFGTQSANGDATECKYDLSYKTYTMSVWVMSDTDVTLESCVTRQYNDSDGSNTSHRLTANKWIRITHSRTFNDRSDLDGVRVRFSCASTCKIVFCLGKVELGNKPTDWTPAPEDVDTDINEAAKTATNFMQFVDGEGLYVGNNQTGTWEGVRTRMDSDSFDVIDQDGNVLASYGAEMLITPNNTSGYKIKMGDSVTIGTRYPGSTEGYGSTVIGYNGRATQSYSFAEGYQTLASGNYTHAEGWKTTASGDHAHSENNNTTASGDASHAEGLATTASNFGSHSEGGTTTASGEYSHAEGRDTIASGHSSHSEGNKTTASGKYSHASGIATKATAAGQFVIGSNNTVDDNAIFIIGNGSYTDISGTITPGTKTSNALIVDKNGNLTTSGHIETGDIYCSGINCSGINSIDPNANFIEISNNISVNGDIDCGYVDASGDIITSGNIYYNIPVSSYDVNALTNTGKYYCGNDATNKPAEPGFTTGKNGWVEVMRYTNGYVHQRYTTYTGNVYERVMIEGTWGQWRIVHYRYAMEQSAAETLVINFLSNYPYTINIAVYNTANVPASVYSYMAQYMSSSQTAKVNANTGALSSTYGTITVSKSGITIKSTSGYKLYVTVTQ